VESLDDLLELVGDVELMGVEKEENDMGGIGKLTDHRREVIVTTNALTRERIGIFSKREREEKKKRRGGGHSRREDGPASLQRGHQGYRGSSPCGASLRGHTPPQTKSNTTSSKRENQSEEETRNGTLVRKPVPNLLTAWNGLSGSTLRALPGMMRSRTRNRQSEKRNP